MKTGISASTAIEKTVVANGAITKGDLLLLEDVSGTLKATKYIKSVIENYSGNYVSTGGYPTTNFYDFAMKDNVILMVFKDPSNNNYLTYRIGTINTTTYAITWGTKGVIASSTSGNDVKCYYSKKNDKFIIQCYNTLYTATLSGTTISTLTTTMTDYNDRRDIIYDDNTDMIYYITEPTSGNDKFYIMYWDTSSSKYLMGGYTNITNYSSTENWNIIKTDFGIFILYGGFNPSYIRTIYGIQPLETATYYPILYKIDDQNLISNISNIFLNESYLSFAKGNNYFKYKNKIIFCGILNVGDLYVYLKSNIRMICAIAEETVLTGSSVKIKYISPYQLYNYFTGLTAGMMYYINESMSSLVTTPTKYPFGIATSDTEILITSDNYLFK